MKTLLTLILLPLIGYFTFTAYRDMRNAIDATKIHDKYKRDKFWETQRDFEE
jgi:hypothetical protein